MDRVQAVQLGNLVISVEFHVTWSNLAHIPSVWQSDAGDSQASGMLNLIDHVDGTYNNNSIVTDSTKSQRKDMRMKLNLTF